MQFHLQRSNLTACPSGWVPYGENCYWRGTTDLTIAITDASVCAGMAWNGAAKMPLPADVPELLALAGLFEE